MDPPPEYDRIEAVIGSVQAPPALRARIAAQRERTLPRRMIVRRMKLTGAMAAAAAALGALVALIVPGGGAPGLADAYALAERGPALPAPPEQPGRPALLRQRVGQVVFPSWRRGLGLRPSGQRVDTLAGRRAVTVYYDRAAGGRLAYTIVAGSALPWPREGRAVRRAGVEIHVLRRDGDAVVAWRAAGQTCVLSGPADGEQLLVSLAAAAGSRYTTAATASPSATRPGATTAAWTPNGSGSVLSTSAR